MTRRDTIIVTALVNAGLLMILFIGALKNEDAKEEKIVKVETKAPHPYLGSYERKGDSEVKKVMGDEVDFVLKQYKEVNPQVQEAPKPIVKAPQAAPLSFVEDLKTVTVEAPSFLRKEEETPLLVSTPSKKEEILVVVKKGDVLEKIAKQNKTSVSEIMKLNALTSTQLKIGQVLKVVALEEKKEELVKKPLDPTSAKYYVVKPGDNLWTIAVKNHIKVEELLQLNHLNEEKARRLKPGDKIRIQ
jgi:peptidoglycan DL-endopeptidase LytF